MGVQEMLGGWLLSAYNLHINLDGTLYFQWFPPFLCKRKTPPEPEGVELQLGNFLMKYR